MKDYFCMAVGALGAAFASLFGGWDAALQTLIIFMAIDYITGLIVAGARWKAAQAGRACAARAKHC